MPPSSAAPTPPRRVLVALTLTVTLGFGSGVASPVAAQVPTTTVPGVLVPGPSTASTVPATTVPPASTEPQSDDGLLDFDFDANEKVWIIVGGLVAVALLLLVLTIIYWRHTKPERSGEVDRDEARATRKEERRRRKAEAKVPFRGDDADETQSRDPATGPLDLDGLLGAPDPARSVFGAPDDPGESPR
jgi:hypothetical protein